MKTPKVTRFLAAFPDSKVTDTPLILSGESPSMFDRLRQYDEDLLAAVVARMEASEAFRRRVHGESERIGKGQPGRLAPSRGRPAMIKALLTAGFSKDEIVQHIERHYGVELRQVERDLASIRACEIDQLVADGCTQDEIIAQIKLKFGVPTKRQAACDLERIRARKAPAKH